MSFRPVVSQSRAQPTMEGAGVHLHRVFGFGIRESDPFLLLDDFRNDDPAAYAAGFPWHPHRGIETITYVLDGSVEHSDSLGNRGVLGPGSVQWMTAGSGILHQEMPRGAASGRMHGFQLWANLPSSLKMTSPRYQDIQGSDVTEIVDDDGTVVKIIIGSFWGKKGPVDGIAAEPLYLDVTVPAGVKKTLPVDTRANAFAYVFEGSGRFRDAAAPEGVRVEKEFRGRSSTSATFGEPDAGAVRLGRRGDRRGGAGGVRFLLVAGRPLKEPVAWQGPIVMNTREELIEAMQELRNGSFIKASA